MLALETLANRVAKLGERFQSKRFGKLVVKGNRARRFDLLRRHRKHCVSTGERFDAIILGKFYLHGAAFPGFDADELILETGNELGRAKHKGDVIARTAFEWRAVNAALERNRDAIAQRCRRIGAIVEGAALLGDRLQSLIDFGILDRSFKPHELDGFE